MLAHPLKHLKYTMQVEVSMRIMDHANSSTKTRQATIRMVVVLVTMALMIVVPLHYSLPAVYAHEYRGGHHYSDNSQIRNSQIENCNTISTSNGGSGNGGNGGDSAGGPGGNANGGNGGATPGAAGGNAPGAPGSDSNGGNGSGGSSTSSGTTNCSNLAINTIDRG